MRIVFRFLSNLDTKFDNDIPTFRNIKAQWYPQKSIISMIEKHVINKALRDEVLHYSTVGVVGSCQSNPRFKISKMADFERF